MPEALTESFCERCGTRYEFAAPTQLNTLRKTRGLISGLRNYIMSQDTLSDAVGDAMRSEEETLASAQLDAFHDSFNFCIQCRQYTCVNCWNEAEGRCRTCVPIPGTDDLIERFEASFAAQHPGATGEAVTELDEADLNRRLGVEAWPTADLSTASGNGQHALGWPAEVEPEPEPEPVVAEVEPEPEPEPVVAEVEPEPEPEPVVAEVEPEPEPVVAEVEPEPEPEPPQPIRPIAPIRETILHLPAEPREAPAEEPPAVAAADESPEVAARRAQLDLLGLGDADRAGAAQQPAVLPYRSRGAAAGPIELAARAGGAGFWEASAREVAGAAANIGVQNCGQCGLSLSASARFCRRCGTRQAQSA